ncbi:MAG: hypothetical protein NT126_03380 [Bacteroidetes bacterium]|nr:hypothetical protein [Bacteroidota bacterium]
MNKYLTILLFGQLWGCSQPTTKPQPSTSNPDSLATQLEELREKYRPGLGEIMGGIQTHHAKLWFAGINNNWKLADYEIAEIKERIEEAAEIETNRPEVKTISMIYPAIDSVANSIRQQNLAAFKNNFQVLTNTCNTCHVANHFEFNVITIPTAPPVYNQDFKAQVK